MKGVVFSLFNQLVEEKFGFEMWDTLLENVKPKSEGIYTAGETYDDAEMFALVGELSTQTNIAAPDLVRTFGEYMFPKLAENYPVFVENQPSLKAFLKTVHDVIHVEVKKLFPEAGLPMIEYEEPSEDQLVMLYRSPRKLCHLSEGLINGAAKHFGQQVSIKQPCCMHNDDDHCRIEMKFH